MNISHVGIGTGEGLTFELEAGLKIAPGTQANFAHYNKLAKRGATAGTVALATAGAVAVGVIVDCSSKGDSVTVEKCGFEWVKYNGTAPAYGDLVTVSDANDGTVELIAADVTPGTGPSVKIQVGERTSGTWQVDAVDTAKSMVLIDLEARL